eukprot:14459649-Heterocapsa_arctica.AAC.1
MVWTFVRTRGGPRATSGAQWASCPLDADWVHDPLHGHRGICGRKGRVGVVEVQPRQESIA